MVAVGRLVGLARAGAASHPGSDGGRTDEQEEIPPLDRHPDTLPRVRRASHPRSLLSGPDRLDRLHAQRPPRWY